MAISPFLRDLLTAAGPSGYEQAPAAVWRDEAAGFAEVSGDHVGSSVARVAGRGEGPSIAFYGHIDEIGLIVSHIDDTGYLWFLGVGGWDPVILVGQRVEVITKDGSIPGVVGKKPIHLLKPDERDKAPKLRDLHIDIGAENGDEARALVGIGDVAVIAGDPVELPNGRIVSRALDNRLGCFVALEAARRVSEAGGAAGDVLAMAVVQEETSFAGAHTATYAQRPDIAVVIDVTHATDAPGVEEKEQGSHPLGSCAVVTRGTTLSPRMFTLLHDTAQDEEIAFSVQASDRSTGTDADAVHMSRAGIPTGVLSIPLRYMHSPVELVQMSDVEACIALLAAFAQRVDSSVTFAR